MGLKRYYTAFNRYKRSKGFGIHSPFAFKFVLDVLRERSQYYSYEYIDSLRTQVKAHVSNQWPHPRIISLKNAKLTFRIVNFYNPSHILQIGTSYGISSACMLSVSSEIKLSLYEPNFQKYPVTDKVLEDYMPRINLFDDIEQCIASYRNSLRETDQPFILVNDIKESEYPELLEYLKEICKTQGTIVMRNVSRSSVMRRLWFTCRDCSQTGMTFSNEKYSVITASTKLPHQNFFLWF